MRISHWYVVASIGRTGLSNLERRTFNPVGGKSHMNRYQHLLPLCIVIGMYSSSTSHAQIEVSELNAQQVRDGLVAGEFSVTELTQAFLDRISAFELNYNAFTSFSEEALAVAGELDEEFAVSGLRGPLHGVPVVIKESIDIAGMPSTAGFAGFSEQAGGTDLIPKIDSPVVARLKDAGAVILGKTNIPQFSLDPTRTTGAFSSWDGNTFNAYDRDLAPGGSSAGTATAVSASFAVLGLGEESAGSIQNPAGAQNLVGIKPTFGLVPNAGVAPLSGSTRDVVGPLAKNVYDAAITLDVIAGTSPEDPKTNSSNEHIPDGGYTSLLSETAIEGKRIGVYGPGWRTQPLSPETQSLYDEALDVLVDQGATLVDDPFAESGFHRLANIGGAGIDMRGFESVVFDFEQYLDRIFAPDSHSTALESLKEHTGVDLFGGPLSLLANLAGVPSSSLQNPDLQPDLSGFQEVQDGYLEAFRHVLEANDLDALVFPQMLTETPQLSGSGSISASTVSEIDIMGTPGVTVPAGYFASGAPFSLMFTGELYSEATLLAYAYDYEQATLHRIAPELLNVADINQNGAVDFADFLVLQNNFGKRRSGTNRGDLNADGEVGFADFLFLAKHFGQGASNPTSVPEPSAMTLSLLCALTRLGCRKRR